MERIAVGRAGSSLSLNHFRTFPAGGARRCADECGRSRLSTIFIGRAVGADPRAVNSRRARRRIIVRASNAAAVAAPLGARKLVEDGKRKTRKARPTRRKRKSGDAAAAAAMKGAELQRLAEVLESAYRKDATTDQSDYENTLKNLEAQVRDAAGSDAAPGEAAVSSSSPTISSVRKRRGRPPAAPRGSPEQRPAVVAPQKTKDGFVVRPVVVKRRTGEGKCRLDLGSRIALRKRRQERVPEEGDVGTDSGKALQDIWSEEAEKLIVAHGNGLELGVVDWENLHRGLLSPDEESELAFLLKPTKNFEKLHETLTADLARDPSDEEWAAAAQLDVHTLRRHLLLGKAARAKLIKHNLRLVLFQAHKFHNQHSSLSLRDLCQEGVSGLIHGVDKFDPKRRHRFSTYAVYWIRNSILRAQTRCGSSIRSPYNIAMHKLNIKRTRLELLVELERAPTDEEVMTRLGLAPDRFRDIVRAGARTSSMHRTSAVTGEELVETLEDKSARPGRTHASSHRDESSLRYGLDDVLNSLKPREGLVLKQRFGLDGHGERTLGEIGYNLGLSREMVRKYEACALMKMKHPTRMDYLRSYLSGA